MRSWCVFSMESPKKHKKGLDMNEDCLNKIISKLDSLDRNLDTLIQQVDILIKIANSPFTKPMPHLSQSLNHYPSANDAIRLLNEIIDEENRQCGW